MLTSGRDSLHNLIDVRTMQVCGKFNYIGQGGRNILATKCVSPDEDFVVVDSAEQMEQFTCGR